MSPTENQHSSSTSGRPIYIRLPKPGEQCAITGLSRSKLNELILPNPRNQFSPPVLSKSLRKPGSSKSVDLARMSMAFGQIKTKRFIEIPIHPELGKWLATRSRTAPGQPIFPTFHGSPIAGATGLSSRFKAIMSRAGIDVSVTGRTGNKGRNRSSHSFHSLRHSFNSAMANAGVSQELRQRLTGHASKAVNDRYTHTDLETLRNVVGSVPSLLPPL